MGKIKEIKKSRKECVCSKCHQIIPVGSTYLRGIINFHPDIVRCVKCGLKSYEVTTSDYLRAVGEITSEWQENGYDFQTIADELTSIRDEQQYRLDNMPEQLQDSDTGTMLQERIDGLDAAIDELESIDEDSIFSEKISEVVDREDADEFNLTPEEHDEVEQVVNEEIESLIDSALQNIVE